MNYEDQELRNIMQAKFSGFKRETSMQLGDFHYPKPAFSIPTTSLTITGAVIASVSAYLFFGIENRTETYIPGDQDQIIEMESGNSPESTTVNEEFEEKDNTQIVANRSSPIPINPLYESDDAVASENEVKTTLEKSSSEPVVIEEINDVETRESAITEITESDALILARYPLDYEANMNSFNPTFHEIDLHRKQYQSLIFFEVLSIKDFQWISPNESDTILIENIEIGEADQAAPLALGIGYRRLLNNRSMVSAGILYRSYASNIRYNRSGQLATEEKLNQKMAVQSIGLKAGITKPLSKKPIANHLMIELSYSRLFDIIAETNDPIISNQSFNRGQTDLFLSYGINLLRRHKIYYTISPVFTYSLSKRVSNPILKHRSFGFGLTISANLKH